MKKSLFVLLGIFTLLFSINLRGQDTEAPSQVSDVCAFESTFSKQVIFWTESTDNVGVASYQVLRDGTLIATVTDLEYVDTGLNPGTAYTYTVQAVDAAGNVSVLSPALTVKTLSSFTIEDNTTIHDVTDGTDLLNQTELTPTVIINAVKESFAQQGIFDTDFDKINIDLLNAMIQEELDVLNEETDPETPESRLADQAELDALLTDYYNGHSFGELYLHAKLVELAEAHWQNGDVEGAELLYEYSLNILDDNESLVFYTLFRLGHIKLNSLPEDYTTAELVTALNQNRDIMTNFADYFPSSTSYMMVGSYILPAANYFTHFPALLEYSNYQQSVFDSALSLLQDAKNIQDDEMAQYRIDRVAAWELGSVKVIYETSAGVAIDGSCDIVNVSPSEYYPEEPVTDERIFSVSGGNVTMPVYLGHFYDLHTSINVNGGVPWKFTLSEIPLEKGYRVTYNHGENPVTTALADPDAPAEIVIVADHPTAPYNLSAERYVDTFTLSWDWVAPDQNYSLKEFKVYRGGVEIATTTSQSLANIPLESSNSTYTYTVVAYDTNDVASNESKSLQVLPNFTAEQQAYFAWKQAYFGTQPMYDSDDPDGDGLDNYKEYLLGSNPTLAPVADPKSTLTNITPGMQVKFYSGSWWSIPNFSSLTPSSESTVLKPYFYTGGNILDSGMADYIGADFTSYLDVPTAGTYRFYLTSDDGSQLFINGAKLIDNNYSHGVREYSNEIHLDAGVHSVEIKYFARTGTSALKLEWAGPGISRCYIDENNLWFTTDAETPAIDEAIAWHRDSDNDGLKDHEEYVYGTDPADSDSDDDGLTDGEEKLIYNTNPLLADTDGDGVSDYEEVKIAFTNPLNPDFDANDITDAIVVNGKDTSGIFGSWKTTGEEVYSRGNVSYVEYKVNVTTADIYRLKLKVKEFYPTTVVNDLRVYIDGKILGRRKPTLTKDEYTDLYFFTPHLSVGKHTIRVHRDYVDIYSSLLISSLTFQQLGGPDNNANGIKDWKESRLANMCTVNDIASSKVSPACIEGNASFVSLISGVTALKGAGNSWFANVDLSATQGTEVNVSFQNGGKTITKNITWAETNVLTEASEIVIRKGDSLLLNAVPEGATDGSYTIDCDGQQYSNDITTASPVAFNTAGTFTVTGTYTASDNSTQSASVSVKVLDYQFTNTAPAYWAEYLIDWDIPELPEGAVLQADSRLLQFYKSGTAPDGMLRHRIVLDENEKRTFVVRIGENGPILNTVDIQGFRVFSAGSTCVTLKDTYEDGTKLYEMLIIASPLVSNVELKLNIFVAGVLFNDGTTQKIITATDFDAYGETKVYFLYPEGTTTSVCHTLNTYQDGVFTGAR